MAGLTNPFAPPLLCLYVHCVMCVHPPLHCCRKSSIFRCLAGLWDAKGTIRRPGGLASGTAQQVFYIPQKPYNVIGTLIDQLTCKPSAA
jgi:hypothetical protein